MRRLIPIILIAACSTAREPLPDAGPGSLLIESSPGEILVRHDSDQWSFRGKFLRLSSLKRHGQTLLECSRGCNSEILLGEPGQEFIPVIKSWSALSVRVDGSETSGGVVSGNRFTATQSAGLFDGAGEIGRLDIIHEIDSSGVYEYMARVNAPVSRAIGHLLRADSQPDGPWVGVVIRDAGWVVSMKRVEKASIDISDPPIGDSACLFGGWNFLEISSDDAGIWSLENNGTGFSLSRAQHNLTWNHRIEMVDRCP